MKTKFWEKPFNLTIFKKYKYRRIIWIFLFYLLTISILGVGLIPTNLQLEPNQPSPKQYKAQRSISYTSDVLTEEARDEASRKVEPVLMLHKEALNEMDGSLQKIFNDIKNIRNEELSEADKISRIQKEVGLNVSNRVARKLVTLDENSIYYIEKESKQILSRNMEAGVQQGAIETVKQNILKEFDELGIEKDRIEAAKAIFRKVPLQETLVYDPVLTAQKRQDARDKVVPVQTNIKQNEKIVGEGEILTPEKIEALQKLGLLKVRTSYASFLGISIFILVTILLTLFFLYQYRLNILENESRLGLLGILLLLGIIIIKLLSNFDGASVSSNSIGFIIPTAAITMLIAILLDTRLAIFISLVLGIYTGIANGYQFEFAIVAALSGIAGVYSVSHLSQRSDLMRAALYIIGVNVFTIISLGMMLDYTIYKLAVALGYGIANGLLASIATIGTLPFLETAFDITTSVKLLELSNPNHPLLKKLLMQAPGTYHHSIMVGNLAENAADAVGADSLLARAGAYFHDIGKLRRPYFFIENQIQNIDNPHDKLTPYLSTLILTSHIKDGLELAKEHNLPKVIRDIMAQHHGTTIIAYFYAKALENVEKPEDINEADFRYEGPKPESKESAIVMIADSVEASVRSLKNPTPGRIDGMVRKVIKDKLEDGQLAECDLTFKELDTIAQAFSRVFNGIYHARIEYPDHVLKEIERRKAKDANNRK